MVSGWLARALLACIAAIVGGGYAAWVIGPRVIDPTDIGWLANDPALNFNGWAFLRSEPAWHLPPTFTPRLGFPVGVSTSLLNDTPSVALALRTVEHWLPQPFQYFGLFCIACGALQMGFGMALARRWFHGRPSAIVLAGALFVLAPIFVFRLHGHFSLAGQWYVLAALLVHASVEDRARRRRLVVGALMLVWLAGGSHPYLLAMVLAILAAALVRGVLAGVLTGRGACVLGVAGVWLAATSAWFHGYLTGGGRGAFVGAGFGTFSANLNTFFNPQGAGSILLPSLPIVDGQGEGFAYLGLGVMALTVWAIPVVLAGAVTTPARAWLPLGTVCVLMGTLALSHRVMLGDVELLHIALPDWAAAAGGTFRASGRFVWPLWYLVLLCGLRSIAAIRPPRIGTAMLAVAVVLQFVDTGGLRRAVSRLLLPANPPSLASPEWTTLAAAHDHLVVLPAWQCSGGTASPGGLAGQGLFGRVAVANHLTLNSFYAARHGDALLAMHCATLPREFIIHGPSSRTAYVLDDAHARALAQHPSATWGCRRIDGLVLCRQDATTPGWDAALRQELFLSLDANRTMALTPASPLLGPGWKRRQGAAAVGRRWADLAFRWGNDAGSVALVLVTDASPSSPRTVRIRVAVDGLPVSRARYRLDAGASTIPIGLVQRDAVVSVRMRATPASDDPITVHATRVERDPARGTPLQGGAEAEPDRDRPPEVPADPTVGRHPPQRQGEVALRLDRHMGCSLRFVGTRSSRRWQSPLTVVATPAYRRACPGCPL